MHTLLSPPLAKIYTGLVLFAYKCILVYNLMCTHLTFTCECEGGSGWWSSAINLTYVPVDVSSSPTRCRLALKPHILSALSCDEDPAPTAGGQDTSCASTHLRPEG